MLLRTMRGSKTCNVLLLRCSKPADIVYNDQRKLITKAHNTKIELCTQLNFCMYPQDIYMKIMFEWLII